MNIDAPDNQRATTRAQQLLGGGKQTGSSVTVTIPPNTEALWIFGEGVIDPLPTVVGLTTGYEYPVFWAPWLIQPEPAWFSNLAIVTNAVDAQVTISWTAPPSTGWYVVADTGGRFTLDAGLAQAVQAPGLNVPPAAVQVAGSDGTDTRTLKTDATGKLQITDSATSAAIGPPGSPPPADAIQIGGTDGTDLRAVLLDASGHALTIDQNLKNVIAALAAALPADALLIGGSDGTDLRAILVDAAGHALTIDQNLKNVIGAGGVPPPADGLFVAGWDGVNLHPLLTTATGVLQVVDNEIASVIINATNLTPLDVLMVGVTDSNRARGLRGNQQGIAYAIPSAPDTATGDHPPNELSFAGVGLTASGTVLATPGAGKRYRIFTLNVANVSGSMSGDVADGATGTPLLAHAGGGSPTITFHPQGIPLSTNGILAYTVQGGSGSVLVCVTYTTETV